MKNFNKKAQYPITYGDDIYDDEVRLSDSIVEWMKNKSFQSYAMSVFFALLTLGSYSKPSSAIPIEYGEAAADIAKGAEQAAPVVGDVAGKVNLNQQPIPNNVVNVGEAGRVGLNGPNINNFGQNQIPNQPPVKPVQPAWRIPGPPQTAVGQYTNTLLLIGSVGWICLNASWGSPIFAYGCVGVVGGIFNELRKKCL